eukprot:CAMPEP_0174930150 /NCGR_PEP_ID=MMETSP1355-20121228/30475_1 /TAXON_ID=464990 /ORGANISM="Hemiselmis tepida, Strain CCMP443" /LENGTH=67 /DNA_ID=CAMNT_0016176419 /DNA_START=18 /DNA_END=217 /DNA_ORIENTATION=+
MAKVKASIPSLGQALRLSLGSHIRTLAEAALKRGSLPVPCPTPGWPAVSTRAFAASSPPSRPGPPPP